MQEVRVLVLTHRSKLCVPCIVLSFTFTVTSWVERIPMPQSEINVRRP